MSIEQKTPKKETTASGRTREARPPKREFNLQTQNAAIAAALEVAAMDCKHYIKASPMDDFEAGQTAAADQLRVKFENRAEAYKKAIV